MNDLPLPDVRDEVNNGEIQLEDKNEDNLKKMI